MNGNITKRPSGKYVARYRDAARREHSKTFSKKFDAQQWLNEMTSALVTGTWVDPRRNRISLIAYFEQYRTRQRWQDTTVTAMNLAVADCTFADTQLGQISSTHVEAWIATMHARGLAPGTVRTRLSNVRTVLRGALRDRLLTSDPTEGVKPPRERKRAASMIIPTREQVAQILDATAPAYRPLTACAAYAGLRMGEALALQRGDVLDGPVLRVERQVQRAGGGKIQVRLPKCGSERRVPIHVLLADMLNDHIEQQGVPDRDGFLFTTPGGKPPHQNTIGYAHSKARAATGLTAVTFHRLRHFYASGLIRQGMSVVEVQHALGHESPRVTLSTYAHLWNDSGERVRDASAFLFPEQSDLTD